MLTNTFKKITAAAIILASFVSAAPALKVEAASSKAHTVSVKNAGAEFSGKFTASFLSTIRKGTNRLSYSGSISDAKSSLSELISFYCSMGTTVQFYECKDSSGTYLEITESYWNVVKNAVSKADAGWKSYEAYVADACYSLNLNTTDKDLVDQINAYICRTYDYKVTNAGMPNFVASKTGQCWHYSKLFADMCNAVGISAKKVQNTDHAWNEVTVDGVTYTFDVTYNDTGNNWTAYSWKNASGKAAATTGSTTASTAKNAWVKVNGAWQYVDGNGNTVKSAWIQSGGKWYYLKSNGNMMTSSWLQSGGKWYYLKADGSMATNTWVDGCYVNNAGVWVK